MYSIYKRHKHCYYLYFTEYVDDADLAGHIRTVTEFLRNLCDTVDGPGKLKIKEEPIHAHDA